MALNPELPDHGKGRIGDQVCFRGLPTPSLPLSSVPSVLSIPSIPFLLFAGP